MAKIRNFVVPLTMVGVATLLPKVLRFKDAGKKNKIIKNIKSNYDIDEDNLFI